METQAVLSKDLSQEELELLYNACLSYAGALREAVKTANGIEPAVKQLKQVSDSAYALAVKISEFID